MGYSWWLPTNNPPLFRMRSSSQTIRPCLPRIIRGIIILPNKQFRSWDHSHTCLPKIGLSASLGSCQPRIPLPSPLISSFSLLSHFNLPPSHLQTKKSFTSSQSQESFTTSSPTTTSKHARLRLSQVRCHRPERQDLLFLRSRKSFATQPFFPFPVSPLSP